MEIHLASSLEEQKQFIIDYHELVYVSYKKTNKYAVILASRVLCEKIPVTELSSAS